MKNIKIFLLCHYALAKYILKKIFPKAFTNENTAVTAQIPIILLTILILTICFPFVILLYCYKQMVVSILKYRHKSKFIGLITGCDLMTSLNDEDGAIISAVFFIDSNKNGEDLFQEISKKAWDEFTASDLDKKIHSVRKSFLGYLYYKEVDNLDPRDVLQCIRSDKNEICEEELAEFLNYHCNIKLLPLRGTFNWDFSLVTTPLRKTNGETTYLMIVRMSHYIVDGLAMYNLLKRLTRREEDKVDYCKTISTKLKTEQKKRKISSNLRSISLYHIGTSIAEESQMKYKPKSNGHLSIYVEPTQNYVLKLKEIKNKIPTASFSALVYTAYSASLAEYFKVFTPINVDIPTQLELAAPMQINTDRFSKYFGDKRIKKLGNDFTFFNINIPVIPGDKRNVPIENYMMERLNMIVHNFQECRKCIDYTFNYTLSKTYFELFPTKLAYAVIDNASYNILTSVFPGGPKLALFQDDKITDILFTVSLKPNKIDINFLAFSYSDKFQFAQIINENKFESVAKIDDVLKGILKYIDILYEQVVKK